MTFRTSCWRRWRLPDHPQSHRDISAVFAERSTTRDAEIALMNEVQGAIDGVMPATYAGLFTSKDVPIRLQTTRSAYDSLRRYLAEVPILPHADPLGKRDSNQARAKAELVEKVCFGYHNGAGVLGGPSFDATSSRLADYQVAFYDGVMVVCYDLARKVVYLVEKDPRCHYPPRGWVPWSQTPLDGTLLVEEMSLGEVKKRYAYDSYGDTIPDVMGRLNNAYAKKFGWGDNQTANDAVMVKVGYYRSRDAWMCVCLGDTDVVLVESQTGDAHHPGVCGVVSFKQPGVPLLLGQVGIEAALTKVINQQIQNTERINKAPITGPPLLGNTLRWGEYNVIAPKVGSSNVPVQRHAPDSPNNLTQVMGTFLGLADKFNYNPESNQGQGPANSGKAIQQLQAGPKSLVQTTLFNPYKTAFPRAYDDAMEIELNLWPNERKTATGTKGRQAFEVEYTPSALLQDYKGYVRIEDARPGGYNAFIEATQKKDAQLMSAQTVMEQDPDVRDVEEERRRMALERNEDFVRAGFEALGSKDPLMAIKVAVAVNQLISSGKSEAEARQMVVEQGLLEPPPETEMALPELPPGLPAELAGAFAEGPPPSLPAARGF